MPLLLAVGQQMGDLGVLAQLLQAARLALEWRVCCLRAAPSELLDRTAEAADGIASQQRAPDPAAGNGLNCPIALPK
jgi:hypothetical protein